MLYLSIYCIDTSYTQQYTKSLQGSLSHWPPHLHAPSKKGQHVFFETTSIPQILKNMPALLAYSAIFGTIKSWTCIFPKKNASSPKSFVRLTKLAFRESVNQPKPKEVLNIPPPPKTKEWLAGTSTIWRCISYWKWGFSNVMLVFRGVNYPPALRKSLPPSLPPSHDGKPAATAGFGALYSLQRCAKESRPCITVSPGVPGSSWVIVEPRQRSTREWHSMSHPGCLMTGSYYFMGLWHNPYITR